MEKQIETINNYFSNIRVNNSNINSFFSFLEKNIIHYAVLGGSVRAALNNVSVFRDIDIVYQSNSSSIESFLLENKINYKQNTFKGLKFNIDNIRFDVWNIDNHFAFERNYYKPQFKNIYKTTLLNYDSIVYDFTDNILYAKEYKKCINEKMIDIISKRKLSHNNPNIGLSICKILELKKENKYRLSNRIKKYIKYFYKKNKGKYMVILQEAYQKHYDKKFNKALLIYIRNQLTKLFDEK